MTANNAIEKCVFDRLSGAKRTLATGESCTGGLIAHRLTNVPGMSDFLLGGVVAYSNTAKVKFLAVPAELIEANGAVSAPVAKAMAEGARTAFGADIGVGVTGIAGPGGGSPQKPVGLVYIAVAGASDTVLEQCRFKGTRETIKDQSADKALQMILEYLT